MHASDHTNCTAPLWAGGCSHAQALEPADTDLSLLDELTPHELGRVGEIIAATYLEEHGYEILERGYRCREGEADLIARDAVDNALVLVEVKTRRRPRSEQTIYPEEAVDVRKQQRYRRIAARYVHKRAAETAIRFDVVSVTVSPGNVADIMHVYDAFDGEEA